MPTEAKRNVGTEDLNMAYVYILESQKNKKLYIGSTINLEDRLNRHNAGYVKATKPNIPYLVVFKQECLTYAQARAFEIKIKGWKRKDFVTKVIESGKVY